MIDELRIFDEFEKSFGRRLLENFEEVNSSILWFRFEKVSWIFLEEYFPLR